MAVHLFFNPDLVGQLAACGITARRRPSPPSLSAPRSGFVLEGRRNPAADRPAVTNVVAEHSSVRITGPQRQLTAPVAQTSAANQPQTALELAEECTRLRRDNRRLEADVERLRSEIARLTGAGGQPRESAREPRENDLDDAVKRFALLELDL